MEDELRRGADRLPVELVDDLLDVAAEQRLEEGENPHIGAIARQHLVLVGRPLHHAQCLAELRVIAHPVVQIAVTEAAAESEAARPMPVEGWQLSRRSRLPRRRRAAPRSRRRDRRRARLRYRPPSRRFPVRPRRPLGRGRCGGGRMDMRHAGDERAVRPVSSPPTDWRTGRDRPPPRRSAPAGVLPGRR